MSASSTGSRTVTFYSYKGGTGRSMALANVAWILASRGQRVLAIDWDLEAPGLHRYFAPFLGDPALVDAEGLIDLLYRYQIAAGKPAADGRDGDRWIDDYADAERYTEPLQWTFPDGGCVDLLCAGRQDARYAERVNRFDWLGFYERFGGAAFFDRLMAKARNSYDYVLIDSRTGVSDTSGICTVHLPDVLAVFYTLNNQSIEGASSVATDALRQRRAMDEDLRFRVYPMATRVELAEKDKLEARRKLARQRFEPVVDFLTDASQLDDYFGSAEILYQPYYAYEEILATIADDRSARNALLPAFETLTGHISDGQITSLAEVSATRIEEAKTQYVEATRATDAPPEPERAPRYDVYLSCSAHGEKAAAGIAQALRPYCKVFFAPDSITVGSKWEDATREAIVGSRVVLALLSLDSPKLSKPHDQAREIDYALTTGKRLIPVYDSDLAKKEIAGNRRFDRVSHRQGLIVANFKDRRQIVSVVLDTLGISLKVPPSPAPAARADEGLSRAAPSLPKLAIAVTLLALAGLAAFVLTDKSSSNRDLAAEVLSARLTSASIEVAERDPALSLALAAEAVTAWRDEVSLRALRSALRGNPELRRYVVSDTGVVQAMMSPANAFVLGLASNGTAYAISRDGDIEPLMERAAAVAWDAGSPRTPTALVAGANGQVAQWSPNAGLTSRFYLDGPTGDLRFDGGGSRLLQLSRDGRVSLWSVADRERIGTIDEAVSALPVQPWSADGAAFAVVHARRDLGVYYDGVAPWYRVRDAGGEVLLDTSGQRVVVLDGCQSFVYGYVDGKGRRIDLFGDARQQAPASVGKVSTRCGNGPSAIAWNGRGGLIVGFGDGALEARDPSGRVVDWTVRGVEAVPQPSTNEPVFRRASTEATRSGDREDPGATLIRMAPDGDRYLVVRQDDQVEVWEARTNQVLIVLRGHQNTITDANWSRDGRSIVTASQDGTVRVWDPATAQLNVEQDAAQLLDLASRRIPSALTVEQRALYGLGPGN